jgi:hypothetical protein
MESTTFWPEREPGQALCWPREHRS